MSGGGAQSGLWELVAWKVGGGQNANGRETQLDTDAKGQRET